MREFTGRHMLMVMLGAFGVIVAVNVFMATQAVRTFPGLVVENSYVASQEFDRNRAAQERLGWTVTPRYEDGNLTIEITDRKGAPVWPKALSVLVGRTTESREDIRPVMEPVDGRFRARVDLGRGLWLVDIQAVAEDGTRFRQWRRLRVGG